VDLGVVTAIGTDPDQPDLVVVGLLAGGLVRCDLASGAVRTTFGPAHTLQPTVIGYATLRRQRVLVTGGQDGRVHVWDPAAVDRPVLAVDVDAGVNDVLVRAGHDLVVATNHGVITLRVAPLRH
jgi:hypothetical protein